jgi:Kef-type K+ transport system membrane component KefB
VAALAPLIVAVLPGPRVPQVVILLIGGVLIGPHVLGVAETSNIQLLANIGLGFLFLLVLLFLLLAIASRFGLDVVLGALLAGIVLRLDAPLQHGHGRT